MTISKDKALNPIMGCGKSQAGFSTLAVILILLFMITSLTLYTAMVSVTEQKISSNERRGIDALQAADAGLQQVTIKIKDSNFRKNNPGYLQDANNDGCLDVATAVKDKKGKVTACTANTGNLIADSNPPGLTNAVHSFGAAVFNPTPKDLNRLVIESVGCTDACDCSTTRTDCPVHEVVRETLVVVNPITSPLVLPDVITGPPTLVVHKNANFEGNVSINAAKSTFSAMSGGTMTFNDASPSFKNEVATQSPVETAPGSGIFELPNVPEVTRSLAVLGDANAFFLKFIGNGFASSLATDKQRNAIFNVVKQLGMFMDCTAKDCVDADLEAITKADNYYQVVVVDGTLKLSKDKSWGANNPMLLLVVGDLQIKGNVNITGLVYVKPVSGVWVTPLAGGNLTVNGRVAVEGNMASAGSLTVNDAAAVTAAVSQLMLVERVPGTWKEL